MAMRSALASIPRLSRPATGVIRTSSRLFSDGGKGRVLSEEERAAENIYIQKMEREKLEKLKKKAEKEKAETEKEKTGKKPDESH
ncbi:uncharacterized protein [Typha angustifolia]|uniref:uncharacterized protein n=1 Tax=Typha angustifolia TaxID=59011 RepID=UPI003C2B275A